MIIRLVSEDFFESVDKGIVAAVLDLLQLLLATIICTGGTIIGHWKITTSEKDALLS